MTGIDHDDPRQHCGDDVAAYVLGALDDAEAERFRAHLDACAVCRDEFLVFRQVVDVLPLSAPPYHAPRALRRRVRRAVADEPRAPRERPARARWRLPRPSFALGAVASAAVAAVVVVIALGSSSTPAARLIHAQVIGRGTAALQVAPDHARLVVNDLPAPSAGRTYEVWLQREDGTPTPANALFGVTRGHADVTLDESLRGVSRVLVTSEPAGGRPQPTGSPVISAQLS